jgi:ATP-dependent DNA ligase
LGEQIVGMAVVEPPVVPMLARLARELPVDGLVYEPKWDGFRCLAFRSGAGVELRSRNDRPLARYFPELSEALCALPPAVLDGEIVVPGAGGFDFSALLARVHPAISRVQRLRLETPARYIAFDLLAVGDEDLRERPFSERRSVLAELLGGVGGPLRLTVATDDAARARGWLERYRGRGIDGVVAKARDLRYEPGVRAMVKVKFEQTADCVVAGCRLFADRPAISSLLLGLYDGDGELRHVGVASGFSETRRRALAQVLAAHVVDVAGHPWERGFLLGGSPIGRLAGAAGRWDPEQMARDWVPLAPRLVAEVAYEHVDVDRFRHAARFRRWRPDRAARSCRLEQLALPAHDPAEVLRAP